MIAEDIATCDGCSATIDLEREKTSEARLGELCGEPECDHEPCCSEPTTAEILRESDWRFRVTKDGERLYCFDCLRARE